MKLSRNARSVLIGLVLGIFTVIAISPLLSLKREQVKPVEWVVPELLSQYNATCKIMASSGGISTGVLLDTGFILGCGHGIDKNGDWEIQNDERDVTVEFKNGKTYDARVVTIGEDYSIIQTNIPMKSDVSVSLDVPKLGAPVHTFGFPMGKGIHLTKGYQSGSALYGPQFDLERTSIDAYLGNSGGGIFTDDGSLVGVMKSIGIDHKSTRLNLILPVPMKEGVKILRLNADFQYIHSLAGWSDYVSAVNIHSALNYKRLGFTVVLAVTEDPRPNYELLCAFLFQVSIVLGIVIFFKTELFSD
jgi:hypothetical protein